MKGHTTKTPGAHEQQRKLPEKKISLKMTVKNVLTENPFS